MKLMLILLGTLCPLILIPPTYGQIREPESGLAITDPAVLAVLEKDRFSIGALLAPGDAMVAMSKNDILFKISPLKSIVDVLKEDIIKQPILSLDPDVREEFKEPESPDAKRLHFSAYLLDHPKSGFVLTGIINRMDRAYRTVNGSAKMANCGEIRFIYRFTYDVTIANQEVTSRLPLTASVVMNMKNIAESLTCADRNADCRGRTQAAKG